MFSNRLKFRNPGKVHLEYSWQIESANPHDTVNATATPLAAKVDDLSDTLATKEVPPDLPFSIEPEAGIILPGEMVELVVKFSPLDVKRYAACLLCR